MHCMYCGVPKGNIPHHKVVMIAHTSIISESEVPITVLCPTINHYCGSWQRQVATQ